MAFWPGFKPFIFFVFGCRKISDSSSCRSFMRRVFDSSFGFLPWFDFQSVVFDFSLWFKVMKNYLVCSIAT